MHGSGRGTGRRPVCGWTSRCLTLSPDLQSVWVRTCSWHQTLELAALFRRFSLLTREVINLRQQAVRLRFLGTESGSLAEVAQRDDVLLAGQVLLSEAEGDPVQNVHCRGISRVEFISTTERLVGGKFLTQVVQNRTKEGVKRIQIGPASYSLRERLPRFCIALELEVVEGQVVLHLGGTRAKLCRPVQRP